jgi:hypothetical protein
MTIEAKPEKGRTFVIMDKDTTQAKTSISAVRDA